MLSDESSSDSETGRFKCRSKPQDDQEQNSHRKEDLRSSGRSRRPDNDRYRRDLERKRDESNNYDRTRDRHRYSRHSPIRRRHSPDRSRPRRSHERIRHDRNSSGRSKPEDRRTSSRDRHKSSRARSHRSPIPSRDIKEEIKGLISKRGNSSERASNLKEKKISPEKEKRSEIHKPSASETQKANSPIVVDGNVDSDGSVEVQPGSYYNMIPAIVKTKSEESSEIDSSDDEKLRAKLLNLEKELHKTKRKKHKKKHKRKSLKSEREKGDVTVEVSSTTDIQDNVKTEIINLTESTEVTSTQKCNQKDSSEEGEILSDDSDQIVFDPSDLRHKLKRSSNRSDSNSQDKLNKDVCGPALPPHFSKRYRRSTSPGVEGPELPPHLQKAKNIGPTIPDKMRKVLAETSRDIIAYESSDEDTGIGPLPAGIQTKLSEAHQRLEERALEMKIRSLEGHSLNDSKTKSREQWMLELPEGKAKYLGLEARSFRAKEGPDMSDRSSWTDTPNEKALKAAGLAKEEDADVILQREARARHIANRDLEQEKCIKKHKKKHKRDESLLEMHQKKLKKKKKKEDKDEEKKERRPFSRDTDLQVNRFDEAQKKSIIKKAQDLNSRFSRGEAKFL